MCDPPANIRELIEARVEKTPDKYFLLLESSDRVFTYRQFNDEVNRAVKSLVALGVAKGDRVSLLLTNRAEYLMFYFACFKIGAWAGPVNALLKPAEIGFILSDSEARTVVTQPDLLPNLDEARKQVTSIRNVLVVGDDDRWTVIGHESNSEPQTLNSTLGSDDEAVIIYTSVAALWAGASIVLTPRFSASRFWETVVRFGVTYFGSVATMLSMLNHKYPDGLAGWIWAGFDLPCAARRRCRLKCSTLSNRYSSFQ